MVAHCRMHGDMSAHCRMHGGMKTWRHGWPIAANMEACRHGGFKACRHGGFKFLSTLRCLEAWRHEDMEASRHEDMEASRHDDMEIQDTTA